ncbi:MAG: chorismate synthase [Clostridia bacterium]|nr:chorismate synthase [Clostridia bacterium]
MKNTFGSALTLTLFGESHGKAIGAVLDGLAPGLCVSEESIAAYLALRRPAGAISTARREPDEFEILSGVLNGKTCGTPLCIVIPNKDVRPGDYDEMRDLLRPGHADFTANVKYGGFQDARGGGHQSARLTAALVAAGAILLDALKDRGIKIGTHIKRCACVDDAPFGDIERDIEALEYKPFATISDEAGERMRAAILDAKEDGDSVGGVLETAVCGLPAGVGEPWFDSLEGVLAHALFSIPAVKGVEFGAGFSISDMRGTQANDAFYCENGVIKTCTNNNGGVNGGISNGMPVLFSVAYKPTPTISLPQETVNIRTMESAYIRGAGRHDPCVAHRARAVQDAVTALCIADMLTVRYGVGYFTK